jgi:hypothetical protein
LTVSPWGTVCSLHKLSFLSTIKKSPSLRSCLSGVEPLVGIDVGVPGLFGAAGGVGNPASLGLGRGPWVAVFIFSKFE